MGALAELRSIVGADHVREGVPDDAIDGVRPRLVVSPASVEETAATAAAAARAGFTLAPRGGGTKSGIGNPPHPIDLVLDVRRMDRVLEHAAGDLVLSVEAGVRLAALGPVLAADRQMLALDPPEYGATIGGVIATNASGPRRIRYGTVRDLLIGITVVLADGTVARAGGKVVKNVAGYDLGKLMTGSLGTLGVIVGAVFRLHPRPPARRLVVADLVDAAAVDAATQRVLHSTLVPSAMLLAWPAGGPPRLGVLFEGIEPSVEAQSAGAADRLGGDPMTVAEHALDTAFADLVPGRTPPDGIALRITCLPSGLAATIELVRAAAARTADDWTLFGMPGAGILDLRLAHGDPAVVANLVRDLRTRVRPGHVTISSAPPEVKAEVDVWGPVGDALDLMRRVKDRFDPDRRLNPGRFVGGI